MRSFELADLARTAEALPFLSISRQRSFFEQPEWFGLVEDCWARNGCAATVAAADDGRVAIVCCRRRRERTLRSCTNLYTTEFNLLGDSSNTAAVRELARQLAASPERLEFIQLEGLDPEDGSFGALLTGLRGAGWIAKPYFGWVVWRESLAGVEFQKYLSSRDSLLRNTWRRKQVLLAKTARPRWQFYRKDDETEAFIALYDDVRRRSWKKPEPHPDFIPGLIRAAAAAGALRMGVLFIDDEPAAAQFWIVRGGKATIYKLVYAEEFARFSPGTLLTMEMMRRVLEQDSPAQVDFGRGDDAYKKLWLSSRSERWGIEAANPRTLNGLPRSFWILAGGVRSAVKRKLSRSEPQSRVQG
ncbi:MAG TPA: GNAT family N-acetyltransferase [Rhizomicrobium sp.]|jgi:hypothetical protein|nr:GNAT family N-acetyltransferase [Rhizomicrobium sp.]